ncbi:exodeoxyribonuclease V subunit alpha [Ignatzschineria sp. LJL83]
MSKKQQFDLFDIGEIELNDDSDFDEMNQNGNQNMDQKSAQNFEESPLTTSKSTQSKMPEEAVKMNNPKKKSQAKKSLENDLFINLDEELDTEVAEESRMPVNAHSLEEKQRLEVQDLVAIMAQFRELKTRSEKSDDVIVMKQYEANFKKLLELLVKERYITNIDRYFAEFLTAQKAFKAPEKYLGYGLLVLLVSRSYGLGNTALPYEYIYSPSQWFIENQTPHRTFLITQLCELIFDITPLLDQRKSGMKDDLKEGWKPILEEVSAPLIATENGIYLERNYKQESAIVELFQKTHDMSFSDAEMRYLSARLNHYFGDQQTVDWQKFAAANAILNPISVISGGPGTGKTTTVFKILQTLIDLHQYREDSETPIKILLAAPTGKAAARLSESILGQIQKVQKNIEALSESEQFFVRANLDLIPFVGQTLHRLLKIHPLTRKPQFNQYQPLNFDVLVVDEASMIDQQMFVELIGALPAKGRVIFLGDKDQLASVESGAVMHELCVSENYSAAHFQKLNQLLGGILPEALLVNPHKKAFNYLSFLKQSYRFKTDSGLGKLAKIVNNAEEKSLSWQLHEVQELIEIEAKTEAESQNASLIYTELPMDETALKAQFSEAFKPYISFLKEGKGIEFAEQAFKVFAKLGVLSARRTGVDGSIELNQLIRKTLFPREAHREFFHGLPIMITHNSAENHLFNGDIGLILYNEEGELRAYFEGVDSARVFSIHRLPRFEMAFAMTIHKSQGSEFDNIMLFLGIEPSIFLTKELFYTGITRAKNRVHIFANHASMKAALSGKIERYSFIHKRLNSDQ